MLGPCRHIMTFRSIIRAVTSSTPCIRQTRTMARLGVQEKTATTIAVALLVGFGQTNSKRSYGVVATGARTMKVLNVSIAPLVCLSRRPLYLATNLAYALTKIICGACVSVKCITVVVSVSLCNLFHTTGELCYAVKLCTTLD